MNSERNNNNFLPVLLSKSELRWLLSDINVSKSFEYKIKSSIKRKIQTLTELELPLLVKNNFFVNDESYDYEIDNGLGRDLESGPPPSLTSNDTALVRQRSQWLYSTIVLSVKKALRKIVLVAAVYNDTEARRI
jgi:hypothetical protein